MSYPILARVRNRLALFDTSRSMKLRLNSPIASFSFDDFPVSLYSVAGKMLEDAGVRATYFASAKFMGRSIDGIDYYTPDLLKQIYANGHEIGCHTFDHVHLGTKGAGFARETTEKNAVVMRTILGEQFMFSSFAYPYGDVSPIAKSAMGRKFALCRGVHQELNSGYVDLAQIRIVSLESRHWNEDALSTTIAQAKSNNSLIVFLTHDISASPTPYGSTPEMIKIALKLLMDANISILTLKAAVAQGVFGGDVAPI